jgi:hypothetical protein
VIVAGQILQIDRLTQENKFNCWHACLRMIFGKDYTFNEIPNQTSTDQLVGDIIDEKMPDIKEEIIKKENRNHIWEKLIEEINQGVPILCTLAHNDRPFHYVVIYGYYEGTEKWVYIHDPYDHGNEYIVALNFENKSEDNTEYIHSFMTFENYKLKLETKQGQRPNNSELTDDNIKWIIPVRLAYTMEYYPIDYTKSDMKGNETFDVITHDQKYFRAKFNKEENIFEPKVEFNQTKPSLEFYEDCFLLSNGKPIEKHLFWNGFSTLTTKIDNRSVAFLPPIQRSHFGISGDQKFITLDNKYTDLFNNYNLNTNLFI